MVGGTVERVLQSRNRDSPSFINMASTNTAFHKESREEAAFRQEMEACKSVLDAANGASLPSGTDFHYFKTFGDFSSPLTASLERLQQMLKSFPGAEAAEKYDLGDPDQATLWLMDVMDLTLERVDRAVDEGNRQIQDEHQVTFQATQGKGSAPKKARQISGSKASVRERRQQEWILAQSAAPDSLRPQKDFQDLINNSNQVFEGVLGHWREYAAAGEAAPPQLKPYIHQLRLEPAENVPPHPLEDVVRDMIYPEHQLRQCEPQRFLGLEHAPVTLVETLPQLEEMTAQLAEAPELAVDLEHHSFRTFQGITCLMQISDRHSDFLVDVIKLRGHIGPMLAPLFGNPQVVKVLHGCNWDVQWLQRDFGIYIANLFDTGQAARVLQLHGLGLAYLLQRYCKVKADKRYQLADWRIRPISPEMQLYARMDTHYLLYMYDCLRKELHSAGDEVPPSLDVLIPEGKPRGALGVVLERSRQLSLTRYNKPLFHENDYVEALESFRDPVNLTGQQREVFAALFKWRDTEARKRDESYEYVLAKWQMLTIARHLPTTTKELKDALHGNKSPSMVEILAEEILEIVNEVLGKETARESAPPAEEPLSVAQTGKQTPIVSHWRGPELHVGLCPQATAESTSGKGTSGLAIDSITSNGPEAAGSSGAAEPSAREAAAQSGAPLSGEGARLGDPDAGGGGPRKAQVKSLVSDKPRVLHAALKAKAVALKAKPSAFATAMRKTANALQVGQGPVTAQSIRETFSVPFPAVQQPSSRAEVEEPVDSSAQQPPASGKEIRAVADKLRESSTLRPDPLHDLGDYLPISEGRKRLRTKPSEPQDADSDVSNGSAGDEASDSEEDAMAGDADVQAHLKRAGLTSSSESESESGEHFDGNEMKQFGSKRRKMLPEGKSPSPSGSGLAGAPEPTQSVDPPWGGRRMGAGVARSIRTERSDAVTPFDYSAARAAAPGLDLSLNPLRGHVDGRRGGRGGGRGRGRGREPASSLDPFNMYQLDESQFIRGGKRSAVTPRSGNKSHTFR